MFDQVHEEIERKRQERDVKVEQLADKRAEELKEIALDGELILDGRRRHRLLRKRQIK